MLTVGFRAERYIIALRLKMQFPIQKLEESSSKEQDFTCLSAGEHPHLPPKWLPHRHLNSTRPT